MRVKVTFYMEATDPDDSTGLTEEDFNSLMDSIATLGGYDVESEIEAT